MLDLGFNYNELRAKNSRRFKKLDDEAKRTLQMQGYKNTTKIGVRYSDYLLKVFLGEELTPQEKGVTQRQEKAVEILQKKYYDVDYYFFAEIKTNLSLHPETLWDNYHHYYREKYGYYDRVRDGFGSEEEEIEVEVDAEPTEENIAQEQDEWDSLPGYAKKQIEELKRRNRELEEKIEFSQKDDEEKVDEISRLKWSIEREKSQANELDLKVQELEEKIEDLEIENRELWNEVKELKIENADLEDRLVESGEVVEDLEGEKEQLWKYVEEQSKELEALIISQEEAQVTIKEIRAKYEEPIVLDGNVSTVKEFEEAVGKAIEHRGKDCISIEELYRLFTPSIESSTFTTFLNKLELFKQWKVEEDILHQPAF